MKFTVKTLLIPLLFAGCSKQEPATMIDSKTFVYKSKVYRVIDNSVVELGDLTSDSIRKIQYEKPIAKTFPEISLNFIKPNAKAIVNSVYKDGTLFYKITINGLNDLKESYSYGFFYLTLIDEFGFVEKEAQISKDEFSAVVSQGMVNEYTYNGKFEMSRSVYESVKLVDMGASIQKHTQLGYMAPAPEPAPAP